MSGAQPTDSAGPDEELAGVTPGAPGPSGTGEVTTAGADPAAPAPPADEETPQ